MYKKRCLLDISAKRFLSSDEFPPPGEVELFPDIWPPWLHHELVGYWLTPDKHPWHSDPCRQMGHDQRLWIPPCGHRTPCSPEQGLVYGEGERQVFPYEPVVMADGIVEQPGSHVVDDTDLMV